MIMVGTIGGHLLGGGIFALQSLWCAWTQICVNVDFDPNIYRTLLRGSAAAREVSDLAIELWLLFIFLIAALTGTIAFNLSRRDFVTRRLDPISFGWLTPAVQAVKRGDSFVVAYVLTKTSHEGASVAYEGPVQQLTLDDNQAIRTIVLNDVDRFLVKITKSGIRRLDSGSTPISQLQITSDEIVNVALEVVQATPQDVAALEQGPE